MKDSDFKNLNHVVGALKIATQGSAVSDGYKPDITVDDVTNKLQFILESEQKTDRKAFLGVSSPRKLPLILDTPEVELSGIFPTRRFHEEIEVQRGADRLDSQAR